MSKISELPSWFDRNPKSIAEYSWYEVAPHAYTSRFEYTVPSGRMAFVETLEADVVRSEAATTAGYATAKFGFTPNGSAIEKDIVNAWIEAIHNTIGDENRKTLAGMMLMCEGDKINAITGDLGTGGKVMYLITMKITEFDALQPIDRQIILEKAKKDIQEPDSVVKGQM